MINALKLEDIELQIAEIEDLIKLANEYNDNIGVRQYNYRLSELNNLKAQIAEQVTHTAGLVLYFSGSSVTGSKGILAKFATKTIHCFQDYISKLYNVINNYGMSQFGKIPNQINSPFMITGTTSGSFGFVLEEDSSANPFFDTTLKTVLEKGLEIIDCICLPNIETYENNVLPFLDQRSLKSLKELFNQLYKYKTSLRIVEDSTTIKIDKNKILHARERLNNMEITENKVRFCGAFAGFLPKKGNFEFISNDENLISGKLTENAISMLMDYKNNGIDILNETFDIECILRIVEKQNQTPKHYYTMISLTRQPDCEVN